MEIIKTYQFVSTSSRLDEAIENRVCELRWEYKIKSASLSIISSTLFNISDRYVLCLVLEKK